MNSVAKDAERVRRPKLPKNKLLKKLKKSSKRMHNGGDAANPRKASRSLRAHFCPKCGSNNIFWASGLPHLWSVWECRNCGYRGAFVVKDGELAQKVREDYAKKTATQ